MIDYIVCFMPAPHTMMGRVLDEEHHGGVDIHDESNSKASRSVNGC